MHYISMYQEYVKPELLMVTPVLYILAKMMSNSQLNNKLIPWYLLFVSATLSCLYVFSTSDTSTIPHILSALFTSMVQSVLLAGTTIYGGILGKLIREKKE